MNVKSNSDTIFTFRIFFHCKLNWFLHITRRAKNYCKKIALKANLTSQKTSTISTGIKKYAIVGWLNRAGRSGSVAVQNEFEKTYSRLNLVICTTHIKNQVHSGLCKTGVNLHSKKISKTSYIRTWHRVSERKTVFTKLSNYEMKEKNVTRSTSLKTLRKLSPASFFKSSMVHIPLAKRLAKSSGYLDTSSRPAGTLKFKQKFMIQNCSIFTFSDSISHCL